MKLGFGLSIINKRYTKKENSGGDSGDVFGAMIYYIVRDIITTPNNHEESMSVTASLTYTVTAV